MPTARQWSIGLAVTILAGLIPAAGSAQIDKCQAGLTKNSQKLETQLAKGIEKCLAAVRKNLVKGKEPALAAASCEKALDKLFGLGIVPADKSKIGKFLAAVEKLETSQQCTAAELAELGHLVSGVNAPGTADTDWVASWMAVVKQKIAWTEHVIDNGDARDLIDLALSAGPEFGDPSECDPGTGSGCGTNCAGAPPAGYANRPNLCNLSPASWPTCRVQACQLDATGAVFQNVGSPVSFASSKFALEVCRTPTSTLPIGGPSTVFLSSGPMRTFSPPPSIPTVPAITWCIDQVRAEGWCDCTGQAVPFSPDSCLDHIADSTGTCPDTGATLETDCVCASPPGPTCTAACTSCLNAKTGAPCHSGTEHSAINTTYTGSSVAGSCLYLSTLQFKYLWTGTCVDANGKALGSCNPVGAPGATCTALGGVSCAASAGPDGIACTRDDLTPPSPAVTIPFTTSTARATIENFVDSQGNCTLPLNHAGMNCISNADCDSNAGGDGVCMGLVPGCFSGPNGEDCRYTTAAGSGATCGALESGNLSSLVLTGALPALDAGPGLAALGVQDYIITFRLDCN